MRKCRALYRKAQPQRRSRSTLELEPTQLRIWQPNGQARRLGLNGCRFSIRDAACEQRFVRHLLLHLPGEVVDLITPPDEGAIAPRAARLPSVGDNVTIVDGSAWEALADWLASRGRLSGRTVTELARLALIATPQFAITIGEWAGQLAVERTRVMANPMRTPASLRESLKPLEQAARTSPRVADALVAALSRSSLLLRNIG